MKPPPQTEKPYQLDVITGKEKECIEKMMDDHKKLLQMANIMPENQSLGDLSTDCSNMITQAESSPL